MSDLKFLILNNLGGNTDISSLRFFLRDFFIEFIKTNKNGGIYGKV